MSDTGHEADGVGQADPITGVTAAADDLDAFAQLPDDDEDLAEAAEQGDPDYAAADPEAIAAESVDLVTNDAVAGDTVLPGRGDGNDGPTGGAPTEIQPILPDNDLDPDSINLEDQR